MDIRNFFKKPRLDLEKNTQETEVVSQFSRTSPSVSVEISPTPTNSNNASASSVSLTTFAEKEFDIGKFVGSFSVAVENRCEIFKKIWIPEKGYDFKKAGEKRCFRHDWLQTYDPWLAYSEVGDGAFCKFCVLFKQKVKRGVQGAFILRGFKCYKDFNECARNHAQCEWHRNAVSEGSNLMAIRDNERLSIANVLSQSRLDLIKKNRLILSSIVRTIIFCGTHDLALRGKTSGEGNFKDLLKFRVQAGDLVLKDHFENGAKNAQYTSAQTEHEIIQICENILANDIVAKANNSECFSILADETNDIAGVEQLSLGVRFPVFEDSILTIYEEFLGFVEIKEFDAESIADAILSKCENLSLKMEYCVGQGYDGCSAMSGKENGVKAIIQRKYPDANFVHCSSHRLNLVVNDSNHVSEIRNSIGTIKEVIKFFRDSNIRRQLIPSIPTLCETRWTERHKTVRLFKKNFKILLENLLEISEGSTKGKQTAYSLYCAATRPVFILCVFIISKYSQLLEPISVLLQNPQINLIDCQKNIKTLISLLNDEREEFDSIFKECEDFCHTIDVEINIPRTTARQGHRSNYPTKDPKEYYKLSLFLPYIDSLISSLNIRFSDENTNIFKYFSLYPDVYKAMTRVQINELLMDIDSSGGLLTEGLIWHKMVQENKMSSLEDSLSAARFVPKIQAVLLKSLALPVTTATIERSFSTLRRVKTWLRSTMSEKRISGLCMLSIHRQKIKDDEENFIAQVIDNFGRDERKLALLFNDI